MVTHVGPNSFATVDILSICICFKSVMTIFLFFFAVLDVSLITPLTGQINYGYVLHL